MKVQLIHIPFPQKVELLGCSEDGSIIDVSKYTPKYKAQLTLIVDATHGKVRMILGKGR